MKKLLALALTAALAFSLAAPARANRTDALEGADYYGGRAGRSDAAAPGPGDYVIRTGRREVQKGIVCYEEQISHDGRSWTTLRSITDHLAGETMPVLLETGSAVVRYDVRGGGIAYCDGEKWVTPDLGFDPAQGVDGLVGAEFSFCRTGKGYLMRQNVQDWRAGPSPDGSGGGPRNRVVTLLDETFRRTGEYDLGAPVLEISCVDGVCYARTGERVYRSEDGLRWTASDLSALPQPAPAAPPEGARACAQDGVSDGVFFYRAQDGALLASPDGVYFRTLARCGAQTVRAYPAAGGTVLAWRAGEKSGSLSLDRAEQMELWRERFGETPIYVTLEGTYVESVDAPPYRAGDCVMVPLRFLAEAMGYTCTYDAPTRTATCKRGEQTLTVQAGSARGYVAGRARLLDAPASLTGGRMYVPVGFLAEAAGLAQDWDAGAGAVRLTPKES